MSASALALLIGLSISLLVRAHARARLRELAGAAPKASPTAPTPAPSPVVQRPAPSPVVPMPAPSDVREWLPWVGNRESVWHYAGSLVTYHGVVYEAIKSHASQAGWEPPNAPTLWRVWPGRRVAPRSFDWIDGAWTWIRAGGFLFSGTRDQVLASFVAADNVAAIQLIVLSLRWTKSYDSFRATLTTALGTLRSPEALRMLTSLLSDEWVSKEAARAMVPYGASAVDALGDALKAGVRGAREAAEALGKIGDPRAVGALSNVLEWTDPTRWDHEVRANSAKALSLLGSKGADALLHLLEHVDPDTRRLSAAALSGQTDPRVVQALTRALRDPDEWVRLYAAEGFWDAAGAKAVPDLVRVLLHDQERYVRVRVAKMLGKALDETSRKALTTALRDRDWSVREAAAEALGASPNLTGFDAALHAVALGKVDEAAALGDVGVPALMDALNHRMHHTQMGSVWALEAYLQRNAEKMSQADLRRLADLPKLKGSVWGKVYNGPCDENGQDVLVDSEADPAHLRQLARQELLRREKGDAGK